MSHETMPKVPVEADENSSMTEEVLGGFRSETRLIKTLLPDTGDDLLRTEP